MIRTEINKKANIKWLKIKKKIDKESISKQARHLKISEFNVSS